MVDTFLIYKISERRYNKNVALIASVLFAVMPMTWILRRIYLDTLLMPLLLSSILFAIYIRGPKNNNVRQWPRININKNLPVLLSGIFLGLAIYTKIPAFTMIPVVGYLVVSNSNSNKKKHLPYGLLQSFSYHYCGPRMRFPSENLIYGSTVLCSSRAAHRQEPELI